MIPLKPGSEKEPAADLAPGLEDNPRLAKDHPIQIPETRVDSVTPPRTSIEGNGGPETKPENSRLDHASMVLGITFWTGIGGVVAWNTKEGRELITRFWWVAAAGLGALLIALAFPKVREKVSKATPRSRDAMLSFVLVPLLLLVVGTVVFMPDRYQVPVLRSIFLVIVCLLPASMWYLFIATRKTSVLNDFVSNLSRLGLLNREHDPDEQVKEAMFRRGVYTYIQKFEAIYGRVADNVAEDIICGRFQIDRAQQGSTPLVRSPATAPILITTTLMALGWIITMTPWLRSPDIGVPNVPLAEQWLAALVPAETPVTFAFLGAYFFGLQLLFRRFIRRDLRGSAYVAISMRIILAVIGIWVVSAIVNQLDTPITETELLVLGFTIGVFPRIAWQIVQVVYKKATGWILSSLKTDLPVSDLDGLTVWHEARLEEEDIENIPNMATTDIVELMLSTKLPSDRIIDWVDQAILYTQLGTEGVDARHELRSHGIRTATSFVKISANENGTASPLDIPFGNGQLDTAALAETLETIPQLKLIRNWRGMLDGRGAPKESSPNDSLPSSVSTQT